MNRNPMSLKGIIKRLSSSRDFASPSFSLQAGDDTIYARRKKGTLRGFTLVELLVSIAIFSVMTSVVLANYGNYNTNAKFANASEDVVLALRQAQVYGAGTKGATLCGIDSFSCSYGVYFKEGMSSIVIFLDVNGDKIYTAVDNPPVETIKWEDTISISQVLCGGFPCSLGVSSVTFKRPDQDAFISENIPNPGISFDSSSIILLDSKTNKTAVVKITRAGQISLQ